MSQTPQPDYPKWVHDAMNNGITCRKCQRLIELLDIQMIGVQYPSANQIYDLRPRAYIITECRKCFQKTGIEMTAPKPLLLSAVEALFDHIESERPRTEKSSPFLPSPNYPPPKGPGDVPGEPIPENQSPAALAWQDRRRRNRKKLAREPNDREVKAFLRALNATSFKRSSKSFRAFMKQLGIDIDWPEKGGGK